MTGYEIVREEAIRLIRGMLALMLVSGGVLVLCGQGSARMAISLILGTAFAFSLFVMMGRNAARSVQLTPVLAQGALRRGFALRYLLVGVFVVLAFKLPFLHSLAAILPLFFPKAILLVGSIFRKKGG